MAKQKQTEELVEEILPHATDAGYADDSITEPELFFGQFLKGSAEHFDIPEDVVALMLQHGIAADMGDDTIARGYKWHSYFG